MKGIENDPKNTIILGNVGKYYLRNEDNLSATEWFIKVHEIEPTADNCFMIAKCYGRVAAPELVDTIKMWAEKCLELGCDSEKEVYKYLSDIYLYLYGDNSKAV